MAQKANPLSGHPAISVLAPDNALPGLDDLDDFTIHDPADAVTLKRPSAEYVILLVSRDSGAPSDLVKEWLVNTNFKDAVTI